MINAVDLINTIPSLKSQYTTKVSKQNTVAILGSSASSEPLEKYLKASSDITRHFIENGYNVVAIPGACALISALIVSNIAPLPFSFYGFLNSKESKRKKELEKLKSLDHTIIFYESPHRLSDTLKNMYEIMGNRKCSISREITEKFEDVKGELVIVLEGNNSVNNFDNLTVIEHVNLYIKEGYSSKDAIKMVAKDRQLNKNEVYMEYHKEDKR